MYSDSFNKFQLSFFSRLLLLKNTEWGGFFARRNCVECHVKKRDEESKTLKYLLRN